MGWEAWEEMLGQTDTDRQAAEEVLKEIIRGFKPIQE
jgi:hypothetical protein